MNFPFFFFTFWVLLHILPMLLTWVMLSCSIASFIWKRSEHFLHHCSELKIRNSQFTVNISYPPIFFPTFPPVLFPLSFCHCIHNFDPQKGILTRYQNKNLYLIREQLQSEVGCTGLLSPECVFFIKQVIRRWWM